ncbi:hypothetical protein A2446_00110 [Candidatus Roizmanbacteria bacterium RIFOXYC2_FULL_38_9]|nr:MAG: hypothetical protein A3K21_05020 [Candidatus Roizmanbacteria bacterium RIFOXYC1_FULL_38_14]OGK74362.1 MAG: hypothetical protein A2446_00110 [Candidatus Roizmanbacteria bacterium RIFOXYC2_FULL_38_9]
MSMYPLIKTKDTIFYDPREKINIKINDILITRKQATLFAHRVIYKDRHKKYLITKGDNNLKSDGKIRADQVVAKVKSIKRNGEIVQIQDLYLVQSTLYFQQIVILAEKFKKEKIEFVILKGLPLHLHFEKTHPQRIYMDCDFLVKKEDFLKAEEVLLSTGYKKSDTALSQTQKKLQGKTVENAYYKIINGMFVVFDLHREAVFMMTQLSRSENLYPQSLIDVFTDMCLNEKRTIIIQEYSIPILSTENLIIYLALHFFHHNYRGVFRLELLRKIVRSKKSERYVHSIQEKIKTLRMQNYIYATFLLLKKYFPETAPFLSSLIKGIPIEKQYKIYFNKKILHTVVFDDQTRIKAGIERFMYLYHLSPNHWSKKVQIFADPQVIYAAYWVIFQNIRVILISLVRRFFPFSRAV